MAESNPYEAPKSELVDAVPETSHLAERGARLLAVIIDAIIGMAIAFPLMYAAGYFDTVMAAAMRGQQVPFATTLLWSAIGFALFILVQGVPLARSGQTVGKKILGIRIAHLDGSKPTLATLLGMRYLPMQVVALVPFLGGAAGIVNALLIFRADRRCGHDLIAGTQVVRVDRA